MADEVVGTAPAEVKKAAKSAGLSPLEYMLQVMRDDDADAARRDRMAIAAAPFVHAKKESEAEGVKARRQKAGEEVAETSSRFQPRQPPKLVHSR